LNDNDFVKAFEAGKQSPHSLLADTHAEFVMIGIPQLIIVVVFVVIIAVVIHFVRKK